MRKILLVMLMGVALSASAQTYMYAQPSSDIIMFNQGTKSYSTITSVLARVGGAYDRNLIFSHGDWPITNSVVFPTNLSVVVLKGSRFNISTNMIVGVNGGFVAGYYECFTGPGTATGSAQFIYRPNQWGDRTQYNIGDGSISGLVSTNDLIGLISIYDSYTMNPGTISGLDKATAGHITSLGTLVTDATNVNLTAGTATIDVLGASTATITRVIGTTSTWDSLRVDGYDFTPPSSRVLMITNNTTSDDIIAAFNSLERWIPGDDSVRVVFEAGTYFISNSITIRAKDGTGYLRVQSELAYTNFLASNPDTRQGQTTNQPVRLVFTNATSARNGFVIQDNSSLQTLFHDLDIHVPCDSFDPNADATILHNLRSGRMEVLGCYLRGTSTNSGSAVKAESSLIFMESNVVANTKRGLWATRFGQIGNYATMSTNDPIAFGHIIQDSFMVTNVFLTGLVANVTVVTATNRGISWD